MMDDNLRMILLSAGFVGVSWSALIYGLAKGKEDLYVILKNPDRYEAARKKYLMKNHRIAR